MELTKAQEKLPQSSDTADAAAKQAEEEQKRSQSYEALFMHILPCSRRIWIQRRWNYRRYMWIHRQILQRDLQYYQRKDRCKRDRERSFDGTSSADSAQMEQLKLERMPQASAGEDAQSPDGDSGEDSSYSDGGYEDSSLRWRLIQNKKDHNSYRGETSDKGNVRWRIPLLPFGHEKWNKKSPKNGGMIGMTSGFEKSGTVLTVHLPTELDHPASDEIRRDSDRIIGHNYIKI